MPESQFIGQQSGLSLGFMQNHEPSEDHPDHAEALRRALDVDAKVAAFQRERSAVLWNESLSDKAKRSQVSNLAQTTQRLLAEHEAWLSSNGRLHAGELEWKLVKSGQPTDATGALRAMEIRQRFEKRSPEQRTELLRIAIGRHSPDDLGFLQAVLADNDLLSAVPELIRERVGRIVLELAEPEMYKQWQRLARQLDALEEVIGVATRYVASDANLSASQRAERERDEARRRRFIVGNRL
ncbi:MAG TPA: hypothetical protein VN803_08880 [Gemmatimonadales bacterium]|nr:hypothetical protein [Gemmatimonadales bacterium]